MTTEDTGAEVLFLGCDPSGKGKQGVAAVRIAASGICKSASLGKFAPRP